MRDENQCKVKSDRLNCGTPDNDGSVYCRLIEKRMEGEKKCIFQRKFASDN